MGTKILAITTKENRKDWEQIQATNGRTELRSGMSEEGEAGVYVETVATKTYLSHIQSFLTQ